MSFVRTLLAIVTILFLLAFEMRHSSIARAESTESEGSAEEQVETGNNQVKSKTKRVRGEKEAEGTQAADRFEANTVLKSKYRLNGEFLEVDPD